MGDRARDLWNEILFAGSVACLFAALVITAIGWYAGIYGG